MRPTFSSSGGNADGHHDGFPGHERCGPRPPDQLPDFNEGTTTTYTDSRGKAIAFPLGDAYFADEVTAFALGTPGPRDQRWADPNTTLGPPDYNPKRIDPANPQDVVLGCGGALVVRFADSAVDVGSANCDGAASIYGDREKGVAVYVGDGMGNATEAFSDSVYGVTIEGDGPAAKLWLTVSAQRCGKEPAIDFATENFCDRALIWNTQTITFQFAPLSTVRMLK